MRGARKKTNVSIQEAPKQTSTVVSASLGEPVSRLPTARRFDEMLGSNLLNYRSHLEGPTAREFSCEWNCLLTLP